MRHRIHTLFAISLLSLGAGHDTAAIAANSRLAKETSVRPMLLEGAPNFRDMGGYITQDGRSIKPGVLFRSDSLSYLTPTDQEQLERWNIRRIVDFRSPEEISRSPDNLPASMQTLLVNLPIARPPSQGGDPAAYAQRGRAALKSLLAGDAGPMDAMMAMNYPAFVREFSPIYREWLHSLLLAPEDSAQVFHCTGGRDRTGFASAVLLLALGASKETAMQDYLASNDRLTDPQFVDVWKRRLSSAYNIALDDRQSAAMLQVKREYLQAAYDTMETEYGSIDGYLRQALGVDDEFRGKLRRRYLNYPATANIAVP